MNENTRKLLDATAGIREEYLEEAACAKPARMPWLRVAAVAAVLALVLGGIFLHNPAESPEETALPLFGIRAYATDGSSLTLDAPGKICQLRTGTSEHFPGKETFTLDILLMDAGGARDTLRESDFSCVHQYGTDLKPGDADDSISISWLEEEGLFGYRITGWCEDMIRMDITIRWNDGMILHQSSICIKKEVDYRAKVYTFYNYERGLSTEELMDKIFDEDQNYAYHSRFSSSQSSSYNTFVRFCGGFAELERRKDAHSLLVQRWVEERKRNEHKSSVLEYTGLTGLLLSQDVYWNQLTQKEKNLIEKYLYDPNYQNDEPLNLFPTKKTFTYEMKVACSNQDDPIASVSHTGKWLYEHGRYVGIAALYEETVDGVTVYRYLFTGWFDEPTELILTLKDRESGRILRRDRLLVTPTEDGYQIEVLEQIL